MKHSIHSAITPSPAFDCDFVRAAQLRVAEMDASTAHPVQPPNLLELELALGERVQECELWAQNWRNRVYRIGLASGRAALAKQAVRGTEAMVQYQYNQLELLSKLDIPGMRVPKALAFLRPRRNNRVATLESKWASRPAAGLRACGKNSRANAYSSYGEDLAVAGRTIGARSGCGSLASFITRTNDSAIGA